MIKRVPLRLLCAVVLTATRAHLRCFGLRRSISLSRRITSRSVTNHSDPVSAGASAALAVAQVAALFPGRARCLEQSLTLFVVLRWLGVPAQFRLGAQALPFVAHAWVEVSGQPINGESDVLVQVQPFPEFTE